ncbi:MAG: glucans biosynthesis glucosyltransferase MdoH, partial [Desulfovibrionaceae bacterium]
MSAGRGPGEGPEPLTPDSSKPDPSTPDTSPAEPSAPDAPASELSAASVPAPPPGLDLDRAGRRLTAYLRRLPLAEPERLDTALRVLRTLEREEREAPATAAPAPGAESEADSETKPEADSETASASVPAADRAAGRTPDRLAARAMDALEDRIDGPGAWFEPEPGRSLDLGLEALRPLSVERTSMAPERMPARHWLRMLFRLSGRAPRSAGTAPRPSTLPREYLNQPWGRVASRRRWVLILLVVGLTVAATMRMGQVLPHKGDTILEAVLLGVFAILFAWISVGFWTAAAGFWTLLRRHDRFAVTHTHEKAEAADRIPREGVRTAIVFPVYNEDMDRVLAGVETVWNSVARTGRLNEFDFLLLSDTQDPDAWVEEEAAFARLVRRLHGDGAGQARLIYRRRRKNIKKKSGNVADFCRRFGSRYTYMVVMDADSVMTGETLVRMVRLMERKRHVGILQTIPVTFGRESLFSRAQQFASRLYGPLFSAGLHFWLLGDAQYWGHNAIIRVRPFQRHCGLHRLSGRPPLGGDIISHDFVEAALMRRAGWSVWLAYDLPGSYEESPPTLLTDLSRDRRWCKGNLQHLRLFFSRGVFPAHRALFLNGVLAYGSALLWFLFLAVSTAEAVMEAFMQPVYFSEARTLFPQWPVWEPWWAMSLLATTGVVLFLPKVLAYILVLWRGSPRLFGGFIRLAVSIVLEVLVSTLLAPVRMLFHSKFVFVTLLGFETGWSRQQREDKPTGWGEALAFHLGGTVLASLWAAGLFLLNREFFWWVSPIFIPLILAVPLSVVTSLPGLGN